MKRNYRLTIGLFFISLFLFGCSTTEPVPAPTASKDAGTAQDFFSVTEIKAAGSGRLAPIEYVAASDGLKLALRTYAPDQPKAVVVFYHGAGVHGGRIYNHIGTGLSEKYAIAVITPDMRGHGASEGPRGDGPTETQIWEDVSTMIQFARDTFGNLPLYLGGHSGGAGLILNYADYPKKRPVDGYAFVAPYFGFRSNTDYDAKDQKVAFGSVDVGAFVTYEMSRRQSGGHAKAVTYNFPPEVLKMDPTIVTAYTVIMANAVTPGAPDRQLSSIDRFGLWIGKNDEAFDPIKVVDFAEKNRNKSADATILSVPGENHFSILLKTADLIGPWILTPHSAP